MAGGGGPTGPTAASLVVCIGKRIYLSQTILGIYYNLLPFLDEVHTTVIEKSLGGPERKKH
jgi:hypothetical protein